MVGKHSRHRQRAFTVVELLVVVAIVAVLLGIALPAVHAARRGAERTRCSDNLRQLGLAANSFEAAMRTFPVGMRATALPSTPAPSWLGQLLPFMEQTALFDIARAEGSAGLSAWNHTALHVALPVFGCPADRRTGSPQITHGGMVVGLTSYVGVLGLNRHELNGVLIPDVAVKADEVIDGLTHTLLAGERPPSPDNWYGFWYWGLGQEGSGICDMIMGVRETNLQMAFAEDCPVGPYRYQAGHLEEMCDVFHYWSLHTQGANFAFCDGSTRFLRYEAEPLMGDLASRNGHEVLAGFE